MADKYDKNGYNSSDFKRNSNQDMKTDHDELNQQDGEDDVKINKKAGEYMQELLGEKIKLNHAKFPLSSSLIDKEVTRVQTTGRVPPRDNKYLDVYREKPVKLTVKVLVPVKEHPKFNFIGKLMGPKGSTMKSLQEETMCKMAVLGRGSMRDRQKEEELRNSLDPKYSHLSDELHVEVSALAPPAEAHARIAYALAEVKKYLTPDIEGMWPGPMKMMERDTGHVQRPGPMVGPGPKGGKRPQMYNPQVPPAPAAGAAPRPAHAAAAAHASHASAQEQGAQHTRPRPFRYGDQLQRLRRHLRASTAAGARSSRRARVGVLLRPRAGAILRGRLLRQGGDEGLRGRRPGRRHAPPAIHAPDAVCARAQVVTRQLRSVPNKW